MGYKDTATPAQFVAQIPLSLILKTWAGRLAFWIIVAMVAAMAGG